MNKIPLAAAATLLVALPLAFAFADAKPQAPEDEPDRAKRRFKVTADRIAADRIAKTAVLTGHVDAVSQPFHITSDYAERDEDGVMRLKDPTTITTCTNHPGGVCHWALKGEVEYKDGSYVSARNVWLEFYEIPIFWLPYAYYPMDGEFALRVMPGYQSRWGAYLLTKYVYDIVGDPFHRDNTWWMHGNTRFDLRYKNGVAFGETLYWNLGDFGKGKFKIYYAWDNDAKEYDPDSANWVHNHIYNWTSPVEHNRYAAELTHRWEATERDTVRVKASVFSDSHMINDYFKGGSLNIKNDWLNHEGNEAAWEHTENWAGAGVSVSGPLNEFYGGTARLPEVYFDVQPTPILTWPVNYESENRLGYLLRQAAEYSDGARDNPYAHNPGLWADYETFRFDTYHRFTLPFRMASDILAVVPRVAYRGTGWGETGEDDLTGWNSAQNAGASWRSIVEGGVTFAARGKAWIDEEWQHTLEPYLDVLVQEAAYAGGNRPYVFDNLDASRMWEDQFAGRGRNLPYSYYGITPGLRNALGALDENGTIHQTIDLDLYAAVQFNSADYIGQDSQHKLAEVGSPNYGRNGAYLMPGIRLRWTPSDDITLLTRFEYDVDNNKLAYGDLGWKQTISKQFNYYVNYAIRDTRWWDFSSSPYDPEKMQDDRFNWTHLHTVTVGFTHQPCDWLAWSPFIRWDIRDSELDSVGTWIDYLTDCLGFRLLVEYQNEYVMVDGYRHEEEWDIGFFVYLRALGPDGANIFD